MQFDHSLDQVHHGRSTMKCCRGRVLALVILRRTGSFRCWRWISLNTSGMRDKIDIGRWFCCFGERNSWRSWWFERTGKGMGDNFISSFNVLHTESTVLTFTLFESGPTARGRLNKSIVKTLFLLNKQIYCSLIY